ncbi:hypothetical protein E9993_08380 [Labilibacter sediminis]|nr:hypothetical protein E9993_08380 [Labilibacter sediminis]
MKIKLLYRTILTGGLLCFFTFLLSSCESEKIMPVDPDDLPDEISFSEHITPIFDNKCSQCHYGQTPPDLSPADAYLNLTSGGYINTETPEKSEIYTIITTGSMAQYASEIDRAFILKWIQQGALDN